MRLRCLRVSLLLCSLLSGRAFANDSTLLSNIRKTVAAEQTHNPLKAGFVFTADSLSIKASTLHVYFNARHQFIKGEIPVTAFEMLNEALSHLAEETSTSNVLLLAKNTSGNWQPMDVFTNEPPPVDYIMPKNTDPFPDRKGSVTPGTDGIFPSGGQTPGTGSLTGKTVWLSPGHGWHNTGTGFTTQRGTTNEVVEDFGTIEGVNYYLQHYLANAGANVWSVRERDLNTNEVVVNNDAGAPGYTETGTWADGSAAGFGGTYRFASSNATESATAIFTPVIPQSGLYWVSTRFLAGANRAVDVSYKITHAGGTTTIKVNQEIHGEVWVYLGQFYFEAGGTNRVVISNMSTDPGQAIIADAVRFGGGIGQSPDCVNGGAASGKPRFEESARQYAQFQSYPVCREDVTVRPFFTEYELKKGLAADTANAVFVSWHTNAGGGTGTETFSYNGGGASQPNITPGSEALRDSVQNQIIADIRAGYRSTWANRGPKTQNLGELRELRIIPGILVELAFHDLAADANDLKTPEFRRIAARAMYKGILKFFGTRDGSPKIVLPEEPTGVMARNIGGSQIKLQWKRPLTGGILGDSATAYRLYISTNGKGFADGIAVNDTNYIFTGSPNKTYYFKVSATNPGGESFTSSVVAARTPGDAVSAQAPYLIVDAFDRLDRSAMILKNEGTTLGNVRRMFLERMNRYDYMIEHATGIGNCGMWFDGAQNECVSADMISLGGYFAVDWFTGEESTADRSIDSVERVRIKAYLNAGGNLMVSGAEIAWDLGRSASANADLDFFNNYLKATYIGDDANTYNFSGTPIFFTGQNGTFDNSTAGYYDVDFPDRIGTNGGSNVAISYSGGTADGAAVSYTGGYKLLYFAFPLETITDATIRNNLFCNSVSFLTPSLPVTGLVLTGSNSNGMNKLQWNTQTEINTRYLLVERSANGVVFETISPAIKPLGNANNGASYAFTDAQVLPAGYYRIKAVDKDGKFTLSNTVYLKDGKPRSFYVLNNPAQGTLHVQLNESGRSNLQLRNISGQTLHSQTVTGAQVMHIPVQGYAAGTYLLSVVNDKKVETVKVVIR